MFQLQVQGTDKGGRVSETPARVEISVYSGVVHPPAFTMTMYNFSVVEDVQAGALVGKVEATVDSSSSSGSSGEGDEIVGCVMCVVDLGSVCVCVCVCAGGGVSLPSLCDT